MLVAYTLSPKGPHRLDAGNEAIPETAGWLDLHNPTEAEQKAAQALIGAELPTREETQEIEFSSRFYTDNGAVFMTATILTGVDAGNPTLVPLTMVAAGERFVTLRYDELRVLKLFLARAGKPETMCASSADIFTLLIEAIVERTADVIERISAEVDRLNSEIFKHRGPKRRERQLSAIIRDVGAQDDLAAKARESLASLERLVQFAGLALPSAFQKGQRRARLKLAARDIRSLEDHVLFLSTKISFLLDATLGLISVEQNEVISVLTIVATFFFPPTLIATIYGMNFEWMPELEWPYSYPLSLLAMLASVAVPYIYFKRKGWL